MSNIEIKKEGSAAISNLDETTAKLQLLFSLSVAAAFVVSGILMMTCSALALGGLSTWLNPGWWKRTQWSAVNILYGIILAAVLWGIFWTGGDF